MLPHALKYAARGWRIFPCNLDKKPLVKDWPNVASAEQSQIDLWWSRWPEASIGCPTGPGLKAWVLDVDLPHGPATLAALEAKHGNLPLTVEQKTGGGGRQLFFEWPKDRVVRNTAGERGKLGQGLDVRGAGGYVILPPSRHPSGGTYKWLGTQKLPLAVAPAWLLDLVAAPSQGFQHAPKLSLIKPMAASAYAQAALDAECAKVRQASQGQRNHVLNSAAYVLAQLAAGGQIDLLEVESALMAAARDYGLPELEARKTLKSGFEAGMKEPRSAPNHRIRQNRAELSVELDVLLEEWEPATPKPWPVLDKAALPGLAGDFVSLATANSEADPAAVLATFLVRFACEAGGPEVSKRPHIYIGDSRHEPRLFAVIAGKSSKARKGTSAAPVLRLFELGKGNIPMAATSPGPLSSGEGIVYHVRDEVKVWELDKNKLDGQMVVKEPGVADKRLFICDEELAAGLRCTKREGNTLSTVLRSFWDSGTVQPLTKTSPTKTTRAHVCIVAHITLEELSRALDEVELFNGFANRFLWALAKRKRLVSRPQPMPQRELSALQSQLAERLDFAHCAGQMSFSPSASALWDEVYPGLSQEIPGLLGAVVCRAEAQTQRLAMLYALLDGKVTIDSQHLKSALAFWRYCEASAAHIFAGRQADPLREKILSALKQAPGLLSASDLHKALNNHATSRQLKASLEALVASGQVIHAKEPTKSKPRNLFSLSENCESGELSFSKPDEAAESSQNSLNSQGSLAISESGFEPWTGPAEVTL